MKWIVPAKTFLVGEYAAIAGESAILLTTTPHFELTLSNTPGLKGIHSDSPAGRWWGQQKGVNEGLIWHDPYQGRGGLGASSAQFLACYWASAHLQNKPVETQALLADYYQCAWTGEGLKPSGYDLLAQSQKGCVFINNNSQTQIVSTWPFEDLSFLILHTGNKLATHHHLQSTCLPTNTAALSAIVDKAQEAFMHKDSQSLVNAINHYHQVLLKSQRVAPESLEQINHLKTDPDILAIKGCGAMGADTLLLITKHDKLGLLKDKLLRKKWVVVASENNLMR